jgi:predicted methyltransferase
MRTHTLILALAILSSLAGCESEPPAAPAAPPPVPAVPPPVPTVDADVDPAVAKAILTNPRRTDEDRARDPRSKPEVVLGLLDLQPGQRVIDVFGGAGYYADMMASMVEPGGEVILHNNTPFHKFVGDKVQERYIDNQVPGIRYLKSEVDDLELEPESLDAALMVLSYHDLYYFEPQRGWARTDVPLFLSQLHAALKPGGRLVVVDHSAEEGSGSAAAQLLHRIDEAFAIREIETSGFRLVAASDALRNPADDRTKIVFDPEFRRRTDRFVLLFERK